MALPDIFTIIFIDLRDTIPYGIVFFLFFLGPNALSFYNKRKLTKTQLSDLSLLREEGIKINFSSETFFRIRSTLPFRYPASMYIRDQFIFICPRSWGWYVGISHISLPIIFARDIELIKSLTKINNIYPADKIVTIQEGSIEIIFRSIKDSSASTHIYIDLTDKQDRDKLNQLYLMP